MSQGALRLLVAPTLAIELQDPGVMPQVVSRAIVGIGYLRI